VFRRLRQRALFVIVGSVSPSSLLCIPILKNISQQLISKSQSIILRWRSNL